MDVQHRTHPSRLTSGSSLDAFVTGEADTPYKLDLRWDSLAPLAT